MDNFLNHDRFLSVVDSVPLVAMDLVIIRDNVDILLGLRNNRPAKNFWFVPGGRIRKNETMQAALQRVGMAELGLDIQSLVLPPIGLGAFEHFYSDCFAGDDTTTHYVVMGNLIRLPRNTTLNIADAQHCELRWWSLEEAQLSPEVHQFTKDYLKAIPKQCDTV